MSNIRDRHPREYSCGLYPFLDFEDCRLTIFDGAFNPPACTTGRTCCRRNGRWPMRMVQAAELNA